MNTRGKWMCKGWSMINFPATHYDNLCLEGTHPDQP